MRIAMGFNCIYRDGSILNVSRDELYTFGCPPENNGSRLSEIDDLSQVGSGEPGIIVNVGNGDILEYGPPVPQASTNYTPWILGGVLLLGLLGGSRVR